MGTENLNCVDRSYESRGVVIFHCFGISKGFQDGVGLKKLLLQLPLVDTRRKKQHQI